MANNKANVADWAVGRWYKLLPDFGIEERFQNANHGPCPMCGGTDRFRYDNKDARGTWFCNSCGSGDGFDLLQKFTGRTFKDLAAEISAKYMELPPPTETVFAPSRSEEEIRDALNRAWRGARDPVLVSQYLGHRGLKNIADVTNLRGSKKQHWFDKATKTKDFLPCMLAMITTPDGTPVSIHRTYLMPDGSRQKKIMAPIGTITGAAVHLTPVVYDALLVAEGIETALAGRDIVPKGRNMGCWSTMSAHGMEKLELPKGLKRLVICADADRSFTGEAAAFSLARRAVRQGIETSVIVPARRGMDMLDVLGEKCSAKMMSGGGS